MATIARHLKVDSEQALRRANAKFRRRFGAVEEAVAAEGRRLEDADLDELEELWRAVKRDDRR